MFRVNECTGSADFLHLGNHLQREGCLAGGFRAEHFNHTATGKTANAQREVKAERPGGDNFDVLRRDIVIHAHNRALTELLFNRSQGNLQCLGALFTLETFKSGGIFFRRGHSY